MLVIGSLVLVMNPNITGLFAFGEKDCTLSQNMQSGEQTYSKGCQPIMISISGMFGLSEQSSIEPPIVNPQNAESYDTLTIIKIDSNN
ncbi:MAG: hypothetical protein GX926_03155 [Candidatus Magasanikbacteria bacterium]|nr:hypothetical protein [Candidatus Magasanikbacteria bacterium]